MKEVFVWPQQWLIHVKTFAATWRNFVIFDYKKASTECCWFLFQILVRGYANQFQLHSQNILTALYSWTWETIEFCIIILFGFLVIQYNSLLHHYNITVEYTITPYTTLHFNQYDIIRYNTMHDIKFQSDTIQYDTVKHMLRLHVDIGAVGQVGRAVGHIGINQ